ncbi:glycine betaine ABC transporter substrate-binding protein [Candidatus Thioglobus sp.]|uniref:glycine betaine ABC transporter substrate-binding protein n=1 Tax=Candidatus Thioglobus sp. TaxID=2026721 RepID=UPI003D11C685
MDITKYLRNLMIIAASLNIATVHAGDTEQQIKPITENKVVKLGVTDLSFHRATGAVVAIILERMGFTVIRSFDPHKENFARLRSGEIDMVASAWLPSSHGVYKQSVDEVASTRELGLHYQPYALWGVPDYIPESEVSTISDLLKPTVKERMTPIIQGIGAGAGITRFSIKMMDEYKLTDSGYKFLTGTQQECVAAFEDAVAEKRWVVVPLWQPQFLHNRYKIRELTDPKKLLGGKDRAVLLARQDSLNRLFTPAEIGHLDRIKLSNKIVAELDYAINRENKTEDEAAEIWLNANHEKLSWIVKKQLSP